jgi:predicted HTH transcriptional regulator
MSEIMSEMMSEMSEIISSQRTIERALSYLQNHGILKHGGSDKDGVWIIVKRNSTAPSQRETKAN